MKQIFLLGMGLLAALGSLRAQSVAVYFEIIPEQHVLQIDGNRRKDMLDMKRAGQQAVVPNRLGGTSELTDLTERYLRVQTSPQASFEMCMFPTGEGDDQVIGVIKTWCAPVCDSELSFYTPTWTPVDTRRHLVKPELGAFVKDSVDRSSDAFARALASVDMAMIRLQFDPEAGDVVATLNLRDVLPDYIYKEVVPYFNEELRLTVK